MMKDKCQLLLLITLFTFSNVQAQYFSKRYPLTLAGYISSIQIVNDTIYAMCQVSDTIPPYKNMGDFVKFDKDGNVLSQSFFDIPSKTNIGMNGNLLIRTNDSGFAYTGWAWDTTQFQSVLLLKYDNLGNLQWYRELEDTNYYSFYCLAIIQDSSSNYYFTGLVQDKQSYYNYIYIAKLDSTGNQIYMKILGDYSYQYSGANGICINGKGNIVVGGGAANTDVNNYTTAVSHMIIYELDTGGNILKSVVNPDINGPGGGYIIPLNDGNYMVANTYACTRTVTTYPFHGAIAQLDSNFNIIWQIDTGPCSMNTSFLALSPTLDGNFIAVGQSQDLEDTIFNHENGWIIKFSENGNIIWNKMYRGFSSVDELGDENLLASIGFLSNGNIIGAGQASNNENVSHATQGWLLRLDTLGCIPDSLNCGIVNGVDAISPASGGIRLYPNPAKDIITIDYILPTMDGQVQVSIINIMGQEVYSESINDSNGFKEIDVSRWATGLFVYKVISEIGFCSTGEFVVSH